MSEHVSVYQLLGTVVVPSSVVADPCHHHLARLVALVVVAEANLDVLPLAYPQYCLVVLVVLPPSGCAQALSTGHHHVVAPTFDLLGLCRTLGHLVVVVAVVWCCARVLCTANLYDRTESDAMVASPCPQKQSYPK